MSISVRILGPVELWADGAEVSLGPAKRRALLAALAIERNRPVPLGRLTTLLWSDAAPASAVANIRNHVVMLRRVLRSRIVSRNSAYQLVLNADELDLTEFETLAESGRRSVRAGDPARAEPDLAASLRLWRGPAGDGVTRGTELEQRLQGLDQHRLQVVEDLAEVRLVLGHAGDLVPLLREHLAGHPLRERAWAQLMLALYRAGDLGAALAAYREAHELLRRQLGVDPGAELIALHQAMLERSPRLDA
ncbi:AfsR/SARP family transcriptional regulator [Actinoplanes sp. CA-142083]|uniref:AfsR/SARP family transcriptional regulator n=1 Tax=Actinoplanes sp. CA-142083 TaxID=3239903 RepID=UPI003D8BA708